MPPRRKRPSEAMVDGHHNADSAPLAKRRSARQASQKAASPDADGKSSATDLTKGMKGSIPRTIVASSRAVKKDASSPSDAASNTSNTAKGDKPKAQPAGETAGGVPRAISEDPDIGSVPDRNPDVQRHEGEWYWLMKAEPETRYENGVDVRFSIDDLRAREEPEPWDGIRAYAARNNLRAMNLGDKAFFYHSNCKEPGIVGIMEIVKEYSEDRSARRPGAPYYDPSSTKEKPKWGLVHVKFVKKFALPIGLKELRDMGQPGKPLEQMQMLKQSRLSVSKVSRPEWLYLCEVADKKARKAGLEHEADR